MTLTTINNSASFVNYALQYALTKGVILVQTEGAWQFRAPSGIQGLDTAKTYASASDAVTAFVSILNDLYSASNGQIAAAS